MPYFRTVLYCMLFIFFFNQHTRPLIITDKLKS